MQNAIIQLVSKDQLNHDLPNFKAGDTIQVYCKIKEDKKERIQMFEGVVIVRKGSGITENVIVRKIVNGKGVEKTFALHSPLITKIAIVRKGKVRRARIFYLRKLSGKAARIKEIKTAKPVKQQTVSV